MSQIGTVILTPALTKRQQDMNMVLDDLIMQLRTMLNSGLTFDDNFASNAVTHTFTSVDTEETIAHGLGKIPTYYVIGGLTDSAIIYDSGTTSTSSNIYLKASATCTVKLLIF